MAERENRVFVTGIKHFSVHDGKGIRTTVFLKGCPLRWIWCHNTEGINPQQQMHDYDNKCTQCGECVRVCNSGAQQLTNGVHRYDRKLCSHCGDCEQVCLQGAMKLCARAYTVEELMPQLLEDRDFFEHSGGGITVSGGECLLHPGFTARLLEEAKKSEIHTAVDTCGYVSRQALEKVVPHTDIFLYDIKAIDESVHIRCTGCSNKIVLENIKYLDEVGAQIEVRIPYVPRYNSDQIEKIAGFLTGIRHLTQVRILPYHNYAGSKYISLGMENRLPAQLPTETEIMEANQIMKKFALPVSEQRDLNG